jgi:predicted nucleic acid-binding protein
VRDVADEPVLATLIASSAEMLVTGDKDLLALSDRYPVLSPAQFCARYAP